MKNQVFLARALHGLMEGGHVTSDDDHVTTSGHVTSDQSVTEGGDETETNSGDDDTVDSHHRGDSSTAGRRLVRDLHWLVGRMARLASYEAGRHPQQSLKVTN